MHKVFILLWCQPGVFTVELCERGDPGIKLFRASSICTRFSYFFIPGVCPIQFLLLSIYVARPRVDSKCSLSEWVLPMRMIDHKIRVVCRSPDLRLSLFRLSFVLLSVRRPTATSKIFKVINKSMGNTCVPVYRLKARQVNYEEQKIANTDIYRLYSSQYLKIFLSSP